MAYQKWHPKELTYALKCFSESHTIDEAVLKFQLRFPERPKEKILDKIAREGHSAQSLLLSHAVKNKLQDIQMPASQEESLAIMKLQREISMLKSELKSVSGDVLSTHMLREIIHGFGDNKDLNPPKWLVKKEKTDRLTGTPVLFLSDIPFR